MATIKIKLKNNLTFNGDISKNAFSVIIDFVSNGVSYGGMTYYGDGLSYYVTPFDNALLAYDNSTKTWGNSNYQYIVVDTSQTNFNAFIRYIHKDNIEGVELEAGTYKWVDNPTKPTTNVSTSISDCKYNRLNSNGSYKTEFGYYASSLNAYNSTITAHSKTIIIAFGNGIEIVNYGTNGGWQFDNDDSNITPSGSNDLLRSIKLLSNQYINYNFYNYAILGNQLVKQATEMTYTCKWYLDGTLVNTSTFTHSQLTGVDYNVVGSVFKVMLSAETLAQYDYGVNLNGETSNASLGTDNVITIEAFKSNIVFNITSNGTTTLATKNTYVPCDIDFNVNVPSVPLQDSKLVELNMADGSNQNVVPDTSYTAMKQVIIVKPAALVAGNIRNGISIAGISGSFTADANATSGNILSGKTAYVRGSKVTGSIPTYSGTTNVTSNQTLSTSGKYMSSNIVVNVPSTPTQEKSVTITENGTTEVTPDSGKNLSKVTVITNVAGITEIATSSAMDTALVAENVGKYYKYTGTTDDKYTNGDIYQVQEG